MESARIVGALARYTGDFPLAEDIAQEALAEALVSWSVDGVPDQPAGWLLTVSTGSTPPWPAISMTRSLAWTPCSTPMRSTTMSWR
jgi:predicted RNA polymerase sigma factor